MCIRDSPYDVLTADEMVGKTLKLVDICTGKELMFSLENKADHQLNLAEVENGFYEVYLVYNPVSYTHLKQDYEVIEIISLILYRNDVDNIGMT